MDPEEFPARSVVRTPMSRSRFAPRLRDAAVVAGVMAVTFLALRRWVGDRYVVPSGSMQPTLFGARERGDTVFVDKLADVGRLRRYDLGVFRHPEDPQVHVVKRVVASGDDLDGCWLELREGDLWLGPNRQDVARAVKHPLDDRDLRVPWCAWPPPSSEVPGEVPNELLVPGPPQEGALVLLPAASAKETQKARSPLVREAAGPGGAGAPPGWIGTARAVDCSYLDAEGNRGREGEAVLVDDVGCDLDLAPAGVQALYCGLDLGAEAWTFHWEFEAARVELWRDGEPVGAHRLPAGLVPAGRVAPVRVEWGLLDGRLFFAADGRADALWCRDRGPPRSEPGPAVRMWPRTWLGVGARAAGPVAVPRLTVFRDIFWFRPPELGAPEPPDAAARHVPLGHLYLLGDNSFDSRDSRMFGPVPAASFVGRPRLVLGPWDRIRWLHR